MVESNHDAALARWPKDPEGALGAHNAYYWHDLNAAWHRAIRNNVSHFNIVEEGMRRAALADDVDFVNSGGSYLVGDVEYGLHGDLGVGARAALRTSTGVSDPKDPPDTRILRKSSRASISPE